MQLSHATNEWAQYPAQEQHKIRVKTMMRKHKQFSKTISAEI